MKVDRILSPLANLTTREENHLVKNCKCVRHRCRLCRAELFRSARGVLLGVCTGLFFAYGFALDAVQLLWGLCFIEAEQYIWI